jgi:hypothetical protein
MNEGWHGDDYIVIFDPEEVPPLSELYGLCDLLPGYRLIGLRGWDDFILADSCGETFTVPTVPAIAKHLASYPLPKLSLVRDDKLTGRIKWYVKPIVFGGSPSDVGNIAWLTVHEHTVAVKWWNNFYRQLTKVK